MEWIAKYFPFEEFLKQYGPLALTLFLLLIAVVWTFYKAIMTMADKRVKEVAEAKDKEIDRICREKKYLQEKLLGQSLPSSKITKEKRGKK